MDVTSPASHKLAAKKAHLSDDDFGSPQAFYLFRLLQSLRQNIRAIEQYSYKLSSQYHITAPQLVCLNAIREHGAMKIADLARKIHLSPSTVVGIFNRLEKKGLITRHRHEKDKRRTEIKLTLAGQQLACDAPIPLQDKLAASFNKLPEKEQLSIVTALEKIVDLIQARDLDAAPFLETGPLHTTSEIRNTFWQAAKEIAAPASREEAILTIRRAKDNDKTHIIHFINSSLAWYTSLIDKKDLGDHAVNDAWAVQNMAEREFFIAESEGCAVGTLSMQFFNDYAYLGYVFIDAKEVGKGFGRKLLEFAELEAKKRNMKGLALLAHPQASWAIKAYQKFGFKLICRDKADILAWNQGALKPYYEEFFMLFLYHLD